MKLYDVSQETDRRIKTIAALVQARGPKNHFHNFKHHLDVTRATAEYIEEAELGEEERIIGVTTALLHDYIHDRTRQDNEERTALEAQQLLPSFGYTTEQTRRIVAAIRATRTGAKPQDLLEQIIKDSDLDNLGRTDFFELGQLERKELEDVGYHYTDQAWLIHSYHLLKGHQFWTPMAQRKRNKGKELNLQELERRIRAA